MVIFPPMEDRNSPEAIAARASQEDPIIMYLIVKESLGMSTGKTAAQCAHASQMLTLKYFERKLNQRTNFGFIGKTDPNTGCLVVDDQAMAGQKVFDEWLDKSFRKVVLRANDHQFNRMKMEVPNHIVVVDAGLTEIDPGSETVLGLWPMHKSQAPRYLQKLQVLK